jgi:hypothetical protein
LIESSDRFPQTEESFNNAFRPSIVTAANNQKIVQVFLSFVSEKRFSEIKRDSNVFGFLFKYRIFLQYEASHGNPTSGIGFLSHVHPRLVWREDAQRELIACVETYVTPTEKENLEKRVNEINAQRGSFPQIKAQGKFPLPIHLMTRSIGVGSGKNRYETQALEVQVPRGTGELMKQLFIRLANANHLPYEFVPHGSIATVGPAAYRLFLAKHQKALDDTRVVAITGIHPNALFDTFRDASEDPNIPSNLLSLLESSDNIRSIERTAKSSTQGLFFAITTKQQIREARKEIDQMLFCVYEGERTVMLHPDTPRPYRLDEASATRTEATGSYASKLMANQIEAASNPKQKTPARHKTWMPKRITIVTTAPPTTMAFPLSHPEVERGKHKPMPRRQQPRPVSFLWETATTNLTIPSPPPLPPSALQASVPNSSQAWTRKLTRSTKNSKPTLNARSLPPSKQALTTHATWSKQHATPSALK